jgi:iron complex outermembrane receptor protein
LAFGLIDQESDDWVAAARLSDERPLAGRSNRLVLGVEAGIGITQARTFGYAAAVGNAPGAIASDAKQTARSASAYLEWRHEAMAGIWLIGGAQGSWTQLEHDDRLLVAPSAGDQSGSKIWRSLNPKFGVLWQVRPEVVAFANLSRSSEPPGFAEYIQRDLSLTTRPQQDLAAQSAWTAEIGTRGSLGQVAWDLSLYHAEVRDEFLAVQLGPGLTVTQNADRTVHQGIEAGLDVRLWGSADSADPRVTLVQSYTWGRFRFDGDAAWGDRQLPGLPEHAWRGELRWERQGWYAGPTAEWQSGWPVDFANTVEADGSLLFGARVGYDGGRGFSAFIEGRNLADEAYVATTGIANPASAPDGQALYNPGDGLAVTTGASWTW